MEKSRDHQGCYMIHLMETINTLSKLYIYMQPHHTSGQSVCESNVLMRLFVQFQTLWQEKKDICSFV